MLNTAFSLTPGDIDRLNTDGFIHLKGVFDPEALQAIGARITKLTLDLNTQNVPLEERSTYDKAFLQIFNLWQHDAAVRAFVLNAGLGKIAADLLGVKSARLYHDQSLYKEPSGGHTPAHADQYYWPIDTDRTITAWIPLQPVPPEMGPLAFYRGSQGVEFGRDLEISDDSEREITARMQAEGFDYVDEPFALGDVSFHLGWTFHRAGPNQTATPRSVMTVIYMDGEARLSPLTDAAKREDRDRWCPGIEPGQLIDSPLNPLIYPAS